MRKHYVTAILGILFIVCIFAMHADLSGASNTGLNAALSSDTTTVSLGNKIISGAANALSFVAERLIDLLAK